VRGGDNDAYGLLFERHVDAARRLARQLVPGSDADDLVSEAFAKVLTVLQRGDGPDLAFRAYLLTAVRRLHIDRIRGAARLHTTDDLTPFDPGVPFHDTVLEGCENAAAARAFASLPERWQMVLWHTSVEGQKPADVAPLLGMSANSVAALAYRAREGLRQAFLSMHVAELEDDTCEWVRQNIGGYLRGGSSRRDAAKVDAHLDQCRPCMAIYLELTEVNSNLAAWLAPIVLGAAGAGYLATIGGSVGAGAAVVALLDRAKDVLIGNAAATTTAAGVAATVVVGGALMVGPGPQDMELAGDPPVIEATTGTDRPRARDRDDGDREPVARQQADRERDRAKRLPGTTPGGDGQAPSDSGTQVTPVAGEDAPADDPSTTDGTSGTGGTGDSGGTEEPQTPEEPLAQTTYDAALSVSAEPGTGASTRITVTVTGVPAGLTGSLTADTIDPASLSRQAGDCQRRSKTAYTCSVSDSGTAFMFGAQSPEPASVTFTVAFPTGTDTDPSNNSVTIGILGND